VKGNFREKMIVLRFTTGENNAGKLDFSEDNWVKKN
jgi:hypothetical protein